MLNVKEVGHCSWHHEVSGTEFPNQAFYVLLEHPELSGGYFHQGEDIL